MFARYIIELHHQLLVAMHIWVHWICDWHYFQYHIPNDLKCIVDIGISVCKTKGMHKENHQLPPSSDFFAQLHWHIPGSWHFIQGVNKGMDPFILRPQCPQCLAFRQVTTRVIVPIISPSVIYIVESNSHQPSTLHQFSNCLSMSRPPACWGSLQCFLHHQKSLRFWDLFFKFS